MCDSRNNQKAQVEHSGAPTIQDRELHESLKASRSKIESALLNNESDTATREFFYWFILRTDCEARQKEEEKIALQRRNDFRLAFFVCFAVICFAAYSFVSDKSLTAADFIATLEVDHLKVSFDEHIELQNFAQTDYLNFDRLSYFGLSGSQNAGVGTPPFQVDFSDSRGAAELKGKSNIRLITFSGPARLDLSQIGERSEIDLLTDRAQELGQPRARSRTVAVLNVLILEPTNVDVGNGNRTSRHHVAKDSSIVAISEFPNDRHSEFSISIISPEDWWFELDGIALNVKNDEGQSSVLGGSIVTKDFGFTTELNAGDEIPGLETTDLNGRTFIQHNNGKIRVRQEFRAEQLNIIRNGVTKNLMPTILDWFLLGISKISPFWSVGAAVFACLLWFFRKYTASKRWGR